MSEKIILDCDPGVDDAIALFLALASPAEVELLGVTTVAGNVALEHTYDNARRLCAVLGRGDIPVFAGAAGPILKAPVRRSTVHGHTGLGGVELPPATVRHETLHAVDYIIDTVLASPGEVTLCAIGPLTNVALALAKQPGLAAALKGIRIMGGAAFCPGNTTPAAEFNISIDPVAAQVVFESGVPLTMYGLDVTNQATLSKPYLAELSGQFGPVASLGLAMMTSYSAADPCLHDPCVIAGIIDPGLFGGIEALVEVDYLSVANRGRTVASTSERHLSGRPVNCQVVTEVNREGLLRLLKERLCLLG